MSASSKKKLRTQQEAAKLTERQIAEQKEAKNLKLYTAAFVTVLAVLIVIAIAVGVTQTISTSGVREKNTVALTVGDTQLSNADLNYFYIDSLNSFYSQNGSYAALFGLDVTKPLNEQFTGGENNETWADYFTASAKSNATATYALYDAAVAAGHTLTEDEQLNLDNIASSLEFYASMYGYGNVKSYLKAQYGPGATLEGYRSYVEKTMLAQSYQTAYSDSLVFEDADLREAEKENFHQYSSFAYNYYHLSTSSFLEGGTTAEDGTVTYSDEERAAAVSAAEEAAKSLTGADITTIAELDAAIAALPINEGKENVASTHYDAQAYASITTVISQWLSDDARTEGDITYLENATTAEDGTKTINGYYVVRYEGVNDNTFALKNVRHILVSFEGGTTDPATGATTYSDDEKAAAMTAANQLLTEWKAGEATEASFAGLAAEKSADTGSTANGGLYEDVYPGQMVAAFEDWCFDESRKPGDTGVVETEYGCHVMYFVGDSDVTYRDYQIRSALKSSAVSEWYTGIVDAATVTEGDTRYLSLDLVLSR